MSDCVCLSGWDEDPADFYHVSHPKARKPHGCCECHGTIQPGEWYESVVGKWEGEISRFHTCGVCQEIRDRFACGGGFTFTTLWDDLRELVYPEMSMCCLSKLSIEAQRKVAEDYSTVMERAA